MALGTAVTSQSTAGPAMAFKLSTFRSTVASTGETTAVSNAFGSRSTIPLSGVTPIWPADGKEGSLHATDGASFAKETV